MSSTPSDGGKAREADLAVLRTAKQAQDEGFITQEDFDQIKTAFTKAQMIKAGLDAGFIREEDYVQARDSFLQALDFRVHGPPPPPPVAQLAPMMSGPAAAGGRMGLLAQSGGSMPRGSVGGGLGHGPAASQLVGSGGSGPIAPPQPRAAAAAFMAAAAATAPAGVPSSGMAAPIISPTPPSNSGEAPGTIPIPTDLARIGRAGIAEGKKSMSGIGVHDSCINIYNHIKTRSSYKWVSYKIDDQGSEVVTDQLGSSNSTYDQFVATLPASQCRFAVYDYAYSNSDTGQTNQKLVFVHWAPQGSTTKAKMMYASTKEFLKGYLEGVGAELQADTPEELQEAELVARITASMARK